jgi:hypothetical protein
MNVMQLSTDDDVAATSLSHPAYQEMVVEASPAFYLEHLKRLGDNGITARVFLIVIVIGYVMPFFGLELLDTARDVAAFNCRRGWGSSSGSACGKGTRRAFSRRGHGDGYRLGRRQGLAWK